MHNSFEQEPSFKESLLNFWKKTFDYSGVSKVSEYWWIIIVTGIIEFISIFVLLANVFENGSAGKITAYIILGIVALFIGLPSISLSVRRLRDAGLSNLGISLCYVLLILCNIFWNFDKATYVQYINSIFGLIIFYVSLRPTDNYVTDQKSGWQSKVFRHAEIKK